MNFKLDRSALVLVSFVALAACRGEDPGDGSGGSSSGGADTSSSGDGETSVTVPTSTDASTSTTDPTTGGADTSTTAPETTTNSFITTNSTTDDPTNEGPLPNGSECASDDDCESMNCYVIPMLISVCAECNEDQDCVDAGTGMSCSIDIATMNVACAPGEQGDNCESDAACIPPLVCAPVVDTGGLAPTSTCGQCADSSDCDMGQLCAPVIEGILGGSNQCVDPMSVANNALCPTGNEGDMACMSGFCEDVDLFGFFQVPVCGECSVDGDCPMGETCMPGSLDMGTFSFVGTTCG